jgi:DNA-binding NarL/FixJ family response regulator
MSKPRVLLADDHSILIEGLRQILEPEVDLVGTVGDGRELLKAAAKLQPDIVITDVSMPQLNGIDATKELKKTHPDIKVIILTQHTNVKYAEAAFRAGAAGYVVKSSAAAELLDAIREVGLGRAYVTPVVAKDVLEFFVGRTSGSGRSEDLTPRQREVLQLIAEGHTNKLIAEALSISVRTAESHRQAIMDELDLRSTAELTRYAIREGLVALD